MIGWLEAKSGPAALARHALRGAAAVLLCCALGCGGASHSADAGPDDAGPDDAGPLDAGFDAGPTDGGPVSLDGGPNDDGGVISAQLNDLSILYPLSADADAGSLLIPASAVGYRGPIFPESLYDQVGHISGTTGTGTIQPGPQRDAAYASLYVVSVRIDPCFAAVAPDPHGLGCLNQIRLVLQEITNSGEGDMPFDSAVHLFYAVTRPELESLVRDIIALRVANGGASDLGALQPHPILLSQGLGGPFAAGLRSLILQHIGEASLTRVAEMSFDETNFTWNFSSVDVQDAASGAFTPLIIPTLPGSAASQQFQRTMGANEDMEGSFTPETTASADLALLANSTNAAQATAAQRQAAFDALVSVENPTLFTPNTIDCASCHLATPTEIYNAVPDYSFSEVGNPNRFLPDPRFVSQAELQITFTSPMTDTFNLHGFSYTGDGSAGISQRVVNETAAIVDYLNTLE